jgi:hypothetical protein
MTARLQTNVKKLLMMFLLQLVAVLTVPVYAEDNPATADFYGVLEKKSLPDYLSNVIDQPIYRAKWDSLFEGETGVEIWLAEYLDKGAVEQPVELVEEGDFVFEIYSLCEPNNCRGSQFHFVVSQACPKAFGVLSSFDEVTRQFGVKLKLYDGDKPLYVLTELASHCSWEHYFDEAVRKPGPDYLYNVIDQPIYRAKWDSLFEGETDVETWLAEYLDKGAVEHPVELVEEGGFVFEIYSICEPHNCWGSKFEFVVSKTCPLAFGLMTSFDKVTRQFGVELKLYDGTEPNFVLTQFAELCKAKN